MVDVPSIILKILECVFCLGAFICSILIDREIQAWNYSLGWGNIYIPDLRAIQVVLAMVTIALIVDIILCFLDKWSEWDECYPKYDVIFSSVCAVIICGLLCKIFYKSSTGQLLALYILGFLAVVTFVIHVIFRTIVGSEEM